MTHKKFMILIIILSINILIKDGIIIWQENLYADDLTATPTPTAIVKQDKKEDDRWYPDVITVNGKKYVPKEDFDYVYKIVDEVEKANIVIVEMPSIEIVATNTGQIYARNILDKRTLRIKIGYIDKSILLPTDWLTGKVRIINEVIAVETPPVPIIWTFGLSGSFIGAFDLDNKGLFRPLYNFDFHIKSPNLWWFNGFFAAGYRPMEPYITLGINFEYELQQ